MIWIMLFGLTLSSIAAGQMRCNGVRFTDRFVVTVATVSDRFGTEPESCGSTMLDGDTVRRIFRDTSGQPYFGYEIRIQATADNRRYRVEMGPVREAEGKARIKTFATFPPPTIVGANEILDIPVLKRPDRRPDPPGNVYSFLAMVGLLDPPPAIEGGQVIDYFSIATKGTPYNTFLVPSLLGARTPPPDSVLTLDRPRLSTMLEDLGRNREMGVIGPVVWLYREGKGRFLFSASARPGFQKSAFAQGAKITFTEWVSTHMDTYDVGLHSNALPGQGGWLIWVKHEPEFRLPPANGPWTREDLKSGALALGVER